MQIKEQSVHLSFTINYTSQHQLISDKWDAMTRLATMIRMPTRFRMIMMPMANGDDEGDDDMHVLATKGSPDAISTIWREISIVDDDNPRDGSGN